MNFQNNTPFKAFPVPGYVAADHPQNPPCSLLSVEPNLLPATKKQKTLTTQSSKTVSLYKTQLKAKWVEENQMIKPWFQPEGLMLSCKKIVCDSLPEKFTKSTTVEAYPRYQYNLGTTFTSSRYRPVAYRVPFLEDPNFFDTKSYTVSHLCHNNWCYDWDHHVLETLEVNKSRNGCPGNIHCHHSIKCIIPGPFSEA